MQNITWTLRATIQLKNYFRLHKLGYPVSYKLFYNSPPMTNQFLNLENLFMIKLITLKQAKLALNCQYQASIYYKKLMEVVYFYEHLLLNLSRKLFVLDFFKHFKLHELLNIFLLDIAYCCLQSLINISLYQIDLNMVNPYFN